MLDKKDLKQMEEIAAQSIASFFNETLAPYLSDRFKEIENNFKENSNDHERIFRSLERNREEHDEMFKKLDSIEGHVKNHEKRIKRLETITAA